MKISLKWLQEYVDVHEYMLKPQELSALLTAAGLEVEGIENLALTYQHVVVGHILEKGQHPGADRLSVCQVSTGEGRVHQIVCGAQNHKKDDRVVVALPGAILPGDFAIKHSKIRGVESGGMLCSETELGMKKESEGILILPADAPIGKPFADYMGFDDVLFEIKVTPNRADCLSHFGLAREVACVLGREVKWPLKTINETKSLSTKDQIKLEVQDLELCPRYSGRFVKGVKVGASPAWLVRRLESIGMKSINNVVDVTNFVMMEMGQPLHAFDAAQLQGRKVIVAKAKPNEKFTTLDGTELTLVGDELTIRDEKRAVCLAGVVGGLNSGVSEATVDLFLECAYFNQSGVRKTSRRHNIETDSAYRFSRGVNPEAVVLALNRASQLIQEVAGGELASDIHDVYPTAFARQPISISAGLVAARMGYQVKSADLQMWLKRVGCEFLGESDLSDSATAVLKVKPPLFRWDLTCDMDLVEEYARLFGYQNIPEKLPMTSVAPIGDHVNIVNETTLRRLLVSQGLSQAVNLAFNGETFQRDVLGAVEKLEALGLKTPHEPIRLMNPLNEEMNVMRSSLSPGLLKNVLHNVRASQPYGRVYEIGFSHFTEEKGGVKAYEQETHLGVAFWGQPFSLWQKSQSMPLVYELKSKLDAVCQMLQLSRVKWQNLTNAQQVPDFLHPGQAASLSVDGKVVGFIGAVHPQLLEKWKIREECVLAELNLDRIFGGTVTRSPKFSRLSAFPATDRDVVFQMPLELSSGDVITQVRQLAGDLLTDVFAFDVFTGGALPAGQKSVTFRMVFQDQTATLEDAKVNQIRDKVLSGIAEKFRLETRA